MVEMYKQIEAIEEGDAWDERDEVVELDVNENIGKTVTLRLSPENWKKLSKEAEGLGVRPGALAATWVLEQLHREAKAKV